MRDAMHVIDQGIQLDLDKCPGGHIPVLKR
jgi:hypothetical protein